MSVFDFDMNAAKARIKNLNPNAEILPVSAKTGEGFDVWADWIRMEVRKWNSNESK